MKPFPWLLFFGSFLYLALFRLLMLAGWEEPSANLSLFLGVGFAYDLMIAAQFCLILGLVARLAPRWVRAVGLGLWGFVALFQYADYRYFIEFGTHLPFEGIYYLADQEFLKASLVQELASKEFLLLGLLPLLLGLWGWGRQPQQALQPLANPRLWGLWLVLALGAGSYANSHVSDFHHPMQNNGFFYFLVRTPRLHTDVVQEPIPTEIKQFLNLRLAQTGVAAKADFPLLHQPRRSDGQGSGPGVQALFRFVRETRPNVVMIVMESFKAAKLGALGSQAGLSPHFDALAQQGVLFTRFFANGYATMHGQAALYLSLPERAERPLFRNYGTNRFDSLFQAFAAQGYHTNWIHAGEGSFDNQANLVSRNGAQTVVTNLDFNKTLQKLSWGYSDLALMDKANEVLTAEEQPFFAVILSLTNHHPYALPENYDPPLPQADKPDQAFRFSDDALGSFFAQAERQPWFRNTLFLITADTGSRETSTPLFGEQSGWIPLLAYWADAGPSERINAPGSQVDLAPSLVDLFQLPGEFSFYGKSLFLQDNTRYYSQSTRKGIELYKATQTPQGWQAAHLHHESRLQEVVINHLYAKNRVKP